ncbi:P-loop containing nucleoside triphosphate hydrolase protein [Mucor mucedo]|uniref:P-loop containing nucleoside triphosphate hydrolase protein n=1 Tax=Mucor mucedo TaxID=29922 RepID=UPI002220A479|nr:P-loop containing nucleoside triphosphate hydrolase protein [Mucor mucedo]KAI7891035.1 P-loop containing nucleoside triphosphate hydrolase protein [Mucor mucedo]
MSRNMDTYNWGSAKKRYEWKAEYSSSGVAPRDMALEKELFGEENHMHTGLNFDKYASIPVKVKGDNPPPGFERFEETNLHPCMKENIALARYSIPTPVQRNSIAIVTAGRDLMACAQTGSGKTAAFLIPTCSALFSQAMTLIARPNGPHDARHFKCRPLVLIMAPTRELCVQIFDESRRFCYRSMLRPCAVYGGAGVQGQIREIEKGCDVLVATPGRLVDLIDRGKIDLSNLRYLVLDEADRMLDMGFEGAIREIVERKGMNKNRVTLMYSATFPKEIRGLARDFLKPNYLFLKVGRIGGTTTDITQKVMWVEEQDKRQKLRELLMSQPACRTLIFVDTKRNADSLDQFLYESNFPATSIHGDRSQMEREDALLAFKAGTCPILVATAVVARGIDVKNVMHVVNYDMTNSIDEYIHRIGRTARVGNAGLATSFFNNNNSPVGRDLTKLLIECKQQVPEFLARYRTNDMRFRDDEDDDY